MPITVKVTTVGNSLGVILPKEILERLRVGKGDVLTVVETPGGVVFSPYDDSFATQMDVAEGVMRRDRNLLRKLKDGAR